MISKVVSIIFTIKRWCKNHLELEEFKDVISEQDIVDIAKRIYGNGYEGNDLSTRI